jgi:glycosyltransferase involved in cell wall biosynthesis
MKLPSDKAWLPRVLILPASYFARGRVVGGGERYAIEYARALAELTPTTLALFDPEPAAHREGNLTVRTFGTRGTKQWPRFPATTATWRELDGFDLFHVMVFPTPASDYLALKRLFSRQRRLVLTDVGGAGRCWSSYLTKFLGPRLALHRLADGLAHLSHYAGRFFKDWKQPSTVLHGGVKLVTSDSAATEPQGYALFVGRLLPHKGVLELINCLDSTTPLRVVGRPYDGAYLQQLRAAGAGKRVTFILDADDTELQRQYAGASVVLQPSLPGPAESEDKSELLGLVSLEGMACGKPVIITRTASLPELVVDGVTGWIVEPGDAATLRARIARVAGDDELSRRVGGAARAHVARHFTWEATARRGLDFYRSLVVRAPVV